MIIIPNQNAPHYFEKIKTNTEFKEEGDQEPHKNLIGPFFSRAPPLCQVSCQAAGQCLPNPAFTQTNKPTNGNENITSAKESFSRTIWSLLQEISVCMQYTFCPDISPQHDRVDTYIYI